MTEVRVRYADTDQGGVVYHSNYLVFFEAGRTEMFRDWGCTYASLEEQGILLPVVEATVRYHASARYDDLLRVESELGERRRVRMRIDTWVRRAADGKLLADGHIWLACIRRGGKPCPLPDDLIRVLPDGVESRGEDS